MIGEDLDPFKFKVIETESVGLQLPFEKANAVVSLQGSFQNQHINVAKLYPTPNKS